MNEHTRFLHALSVRARRLTLCMTRSAESALSLVGGATSALVAGGGGTAAEAVGVGGRSLRARRVGVPGAHRAFGVPMLRAALYCVLLAGLSAGWLAMAGAGRVVSIGAWLYSASQLSDPPSPLPAGQNP